MSHAPQPTGEATDTGPVALYKTFLIEVLASVMPAELQAAHTAPWPSDVPLRELGLDSRSLVSFYAAVEKELGRPWDETVPQEALRTIGAMAAYLFETHGPLTDTLDRT